MDLKEFLKEHEKALLFSSFAFNILLIILCLYFYFAYENKECPKCICNENKSVAMNSANECQASNVKSSNVEDEDVFYMEIKGAVLKPGVYEVKKDAIINDVIDLAGGLTKDAYTNNINLSHKVSSEEVIYIYTDEEYAYLYDDEILGPNLDSTCPVPSYDIKNCTDMAKSEIITEEEYNKDTWDENNEVVKEEVNSNNTNCSVTVSDNEESSKEEQTTNGKINLNTATLEELMSIDYIGNAKAKAIIDYRNDVGKFNNIEEIKNVKGIGDILYSKIKDHITV